MFEYFDAVLLARIQFAFTIAFHIIFPALSIGLASFLAVLEGLWLYTGKEVYIEIFHYWKKIFAITFGMGVVSGLVMSYQFGTNWSVFSDKTGPILGPLLGYEVLSAFFLEAGFLGIMLFGMDRVGKGLHFFATSLVAIGTLFSAFWILSVNSWMQTPVGYNYNDVGQFIPVDWFEIIFNPSFPYRFVHMVLAAYLSTSFIVGGVGAFHLLKDKTNQHAKTMFSLAVWMATIVAPIQLVAGDLHGLNTIEHQPAKVAAMEGHFETQKGAPLYLFGLPNMETGKVDYAVKIPKLGSMILKHGWDEEITGLKAFPKEDWPNVPIVFWSFRIMVGIGMLMIVMGLAGLILRLTGKLYNQQLYLRAATIMGPAGLVALLAGWFVTEVGRQPYTVYGLLRTSDSVSPIAAPGLWGSLMSLVFVYFLVFTPGIIFILRLMKITPAPLNHEPTDENGKAIPALTNRILAETNNN